MPSDPSIPEFKSERDSYAEYREKHTLFASKCPHCGRSRPPHIPCVNPECPSNPMRETYRRIKEQKAREEEDRQSRDSQRARDDEVERITTALYSIRREIEKQSSLGRLVLTISIPFTGALLMLGVVLYKC